MRLKPTVADRFVSEMLRICPQLMDINETKNAGDDLIMMYTTDNAAYATPSLPVGCVSLWSRWRNCRHVYRFDNELVSELERMTPCGSMPIKALELLPYPIVFVKARIYVPMWSGNKVEVPGFFAWTDGEDPIRSLAILPIGQTTPLLIELRHDTFDKVIDELCKYDGYMRDDIARNHGEDKVVKLADDYETLVRRYVGCVINLLLYIVADNSDQDVVYRPSTGRKRKGKSSDSTVHDVGTRIGRALGQARVRYERTGNKLGGTVRPHMRAGHWHHHWVGPRDNRKLTLRWHAPVFVNACDKETVTTIHDGRG